MKENIRVLRLIKEEKRLNSKAIEKFLYDDGSHINESIDNYTNSIKIYLKKICLVIKRSEPAGYRLTSVKEITNTLNNYSFLMSQKK